MKIVIYVLKLYCVYINIDVKCLKCFYLFYMCLIVYYCVLDFYKFKLVVGEINFYLFLFDLNVCCIISDMYYEYL